MTIQKPKSCRCLISIISLSVLITACVPTNLTRRSAPAPTMPAAETTLTLEPLPYTFAQPTQFFVDGDLLWVAQLNGGENERKGQVVTVHLATGEERVRLDSLDKPTGIARINNALWIATRDALLKAELSDGEMVAQTILAGLPNNGRSNGTLTVTPAGKLLFETSGNMRDEESGKLWELDPRTNEQRVIATGLKGAYAHVYDDEGQLWLTEIADGSVDGVVLPGEVNMIPAAERGVPDFGWPRCYGRELTGPDCANVRAAVTTLPTHSTPTSIAISPFAADTLLVALWVTGQIVEIPFVMEGDNTSVENANRENAVGDPRVLIRELRNPQHIQTQADGSVLISDFATGQIVRVRGAE